MSSPIISDLVLHERDILTRIAEGGPLDQVLRDLVLLVETPSAGDMLASVLFVSPDGKHLHEGAAPSLPKEYNDAIHGIAIGENVGSCGTAAHFGRPVIVSDIATDPLWKDFRDFALKHGLRACWSVPIKAADGSVLGTYANYYREPKQPTERDMEIIFMVARTTGIAIERHRHELARQRAEEQRQLLLREMNHRVKNVFALASSLVAMSAGAATTPAELAKTVQGRLSALGRAHDLIVPGSESDEAPAHGTTSFRAVVTDILAPYGGAAMMERISVAGEDFTLLPDAVTGIALVLHELTTNAVKYGCFTAPGGTLSVGWIIQKDMFHLRWTESGVACTGAPSRTGFGTKLTKTTVERQLGGTIRYDWNANGLDVAIALPCSAVIRKTQPAAVSTGEAAD